MRQENKAWKEINQVLKNGNIGRNLSSRNFIMIRNVSRETIYALVYSKPELISDFTNNAKIIRDLGLLETSKAYKRMIEKYTNFKLHDRFIQIQRYLSESKVLKSEEDVVRDIDDTFIIEERKDIKNRFNQLIYLNNRKKGESANSELAQKIIKNLRKKGIKFVIDSNENTGYCSKDNIIYFQYSIDLRCSPTILHEYGHYLSIIRKEVPDFYMRYSIDKSVNTSLNLRISILNRVSNICTLMEEANASYHAASLEKRYRTTRGQLEVSKKDLSNKFRSYELNVANEILIDSYKRKIGRLRNK